MHLLALADVSAVPSIFPEAFGMVAAESAAAGCLPSSPTTRGAEVADGLEANYPPSLRGLVRFPTGDAGALRERLAGILALAMTDREAIRAAARSAAVERWSWSSVASRIAAAG